MTKEVIRTLQVIATVLLIIPLANLIGIFLYLGILNYVIGAVISYLGVAYIAYKMLQNYHPDEVSKAPFLNGRRLVTAFAIGILAIIFLLAISFILLPLLWIQIT